MSDPETASATSEKRHSMPSNIPIDGLLDVLRAANIPIDEYGKGNAKTIEHLLSEIHEGEAIMTVGEQGAVYREVNVLWLDVLCELSDGKVYLLREDRQEFKDGRTRVRKLDSSIGEKLKPDEKIEDAAYRALQEELGIGIVESLYENGYTERTFMPDSFPGIESNYKMHQYVSVIPEEAFKSEGYVEYQPDKTNYYVWTLIHTPGTPVL